MRENLRRIAAAKGATINDLTVCVLDRPRHDHDRRHSPDRRANQMIPDGDVAGAVMASTPGRASTRSWYRRRARSGRGRVRNQSASAAKSSVFGIRATTRSKDRGRSGDIADEVLGIDDLVASDNVFFSATGITDGELVTGVQFFKTGREHRRSSCGREREQSPDRCYPPIGQVALAERVAVRINPGTTLFPAARLTLRIVRFIIDISHSATSAPASQAPIAYRAVHHGV